MGLSDPIQFGNIHSCEFTAAAFDDEKDNKANGQIPSEILFVTNVKDSDSYSLQSAA